MARLRFRPSLRHVGALFTALVLAALAAGPLGAPGLRVAAAAAAAAVAGTLCLVAGGRWRIVAVGLLGFAAAHALWPGHDFMAPQATAVFVVVMAGFLAIEIGVVFLDRPRLRDAAIRVIDAMILVFAAVVTLWSLALHALVDRADVSPPIVRGTLTFLFTDLYVGALAAYTWIGSAPRRDNVLWLVAGAGAWFVADTAATVAALQGTGGPLPTEAFRIAGYALFAAGAVATPSTAPRQHSAWPWFPVAVPTTLLVLATATGSYAYLRDGDLAPAVFWNAVVLFLAVVLRHAIAFGDSLRVSRRLAESEERFRTITEQSVDIIALHDLDGRFVYVSPAVEGVLGHAPGDLVGRARSDLLHPGDRPAVPDIMLEAPADPSDGGPAAPGRPPAADPREPVAAPTEGVPPPPRPIVRMRHRDGHWVWTEVATRVVRDAAGRPRWILSVAHDVTGRLEAEKALRRSTEREQEFLALRLMDRMKTRFLNQAAHQLSTPLTPLRLEADMLSSGALGDLSDQQRNAVAVIDRNVRRLHRTVDDMLLAARLEGGLRPRIRSVDLAVVVGDAARQLEGEAAARGVALHVEAASMPMEADPVLLTEAVSELIENAMRFTPRGGFIRVRAASDAADVTVEVRDDGTGIPAESIPLLFETFSEAADRSEGGAGLGLFIVRRVAEAHGGSLHAQSEGAGRGSTFTIRLPIKGAEG